MFIREDVKKCVVFLGTDSQQAGKIHWGGTGFFVSVPTLVEGRWFIYLVTAKHVVTQLQGRNVHIRMNTKEGKSITFQGNHSDIKWWYHPTDSAADVAVSPITIPKEIMDRIDFRPLDIRMFLDESKRYENGIGEGNDVIIVGLFARHAGNAKNMPIIRYGNVAMFPDERIPTTDFGDMEAYLIESRSIGGLSGSPAFVVQIVNAEKARLHLLGLIHGHWQVKPETIIDTTIQDSGIHAGVNMGIAIVTPAKKILETINQKEVAEIREKAHADWIAQFSPKPE